MRSMDNYDGIDLFIWGNAESCVTIIAASIPILRVLIRDAKTTARRYYIANDEGDENGLKRSNTNTVVVSAQHNSRQESGGKRDDGSDRSILENSTDSWGIMRTKEIAVEFQDRGSEGAPHFEMAHVRN
ncbi:putative integral membrane protein [Phaeoacremonium minimum UCRPA7]|uniref:Putative integral membrane protein n=1 Tax=Phaeoacremonium minimum (strain UCR-PA7) TaxID=1286976 RepID=R8BEZ4_PHAM7|nr:putative integral membrane protein [Phaeoacremonium minimum UCRPA7]EON97869.1 putative integral membrane protein [Phaeoacremonium minimum UCRPA7]